MFECWICVTAYRYAWAAISEWQCHQGMTQGGRLSAAPAQGTAPDRSAIRRTRSVACMTQLQAKQKYGFEEGPADSESSDRYAAGCKS